MTDRSADQPPLIVYTTSWCGPCSRLKARMTARGIGFTEVDIEQDPSAEAWVAAANNGSWLVPTVRFPDGSALSNPSVDAVVERLAALAAAH